MEFSAGIFNTTHLMALNLMLRASATTAARSSRQRGECKVASGAMRYPLEFLRAEDVACDDLHIAEPGYLY